MTPAPWLGLQPRRWQPEALDAVLAALRGDDRLQCLSPLVHACTGAGKSIWLAELAARCKGTVLITTPTQALVRQLGGTLRARLPGKVGLAFQHEWSADAPVVVTCSASLPRLLAERPAFDAWIADEAHRGLAGWSAVRSAVRIGLTATPFRADHQGLPAFTEVVYSYSSAQAVADGVLVELRRVRADREDDADVVCEAWARSAEGPGIVSATSVDDAEAFAARAGGLAIHGRLPPREQAARIEALRSGAVGFLVHCQLLTEGVDLPWLSWLILRRPVSSPVRLVQEVGRVLRAAPNKSFATVYDPYNLLAAVGLEHAAELDAVQARAENEPPEQWEIPELEGLDNLATLPRTVAVGRLEGWVSELLAELRAGPIGAIRIGVGPDNPDGRPLLRQRELFERSRDWRGAAATDAQLARLERLSKWAGRLPREEHRRAMRWLFAQSDLQQGTAQDVIDVLSAFQAMARREGWTWMFRGRVPTVPNDAEPMGQAADQEVA